MRKSRLRITVLLLAFSSTQIWADEAQRRMTNLRFTGWDVVVYYFSVWKNLYLDYPWVVRVSYSLLILVVAAIICLCLYMLVLRVIYWRKERFYRRLKKKYYENLLTFLREENELEEADAVEMLDYDKDKKYRGWKMSLVGRMIVEAKKECEDLQRSEGDAVQTRSFSWANSVAGSDEQKRMKSLAHNVNVVARMFGFSEYMEQKLMFGFASNKLRLLQIVEYLQLSIPESIFVRLLNNKNRDLRKSVRMYYLGVSDYDPFRFFEQDVDADFRPLDSLELHAQLCQRHALGKSIPSFLPYINSISDVNMKAALIREVAWWGSDDDVEAMTAYFTDKDFVCREAAFSCMATRRYEKAEEAMEATYGEQTERLRCSLVRAVMQIGSGHAATFMAEAYDQTASKVTKLCILRCLYAYGTTGRMVFGRLKENASEDEVLLFEQVEAADDTTKNLHSGIKI